MKLKLMLAMAGLALFVVSGGTATAGNGDKVTGGGQVLIDTETERGAGSTLAYNAQGTTTVAKGRVTFIDRSGDVMEKFKGIVDCIEVTNNYGIVGGYRRGSTDTEDPANRFDLRVVDNGEPGKGSDMIVFEEDGTNSEVECGDEEADNPMPSALLARGNAQVRDGDPPPAPESTSSGLTFLSL